MLTSVKEVAMASERVFGFNERQDRDQTCAACADHPGCTRRGSGPSELSKADCSCVIMPKREMGRRKRI